MAKGIKLSRMWVLKIQKIVNSKGDRLVSFSYIWILSFSLYLILSIQFIGLVKLTKGILYVPYFEADVTCATIGLK